MSKNLRAPNGVTEEELVALAQTVSLFTRRRFDSARIEQFGLLVSLLGKLTTQVYDRPVATNELTRKSKLMDLR